MSPPALHLAGFLLAVAAGAAAAGPPAPAPAIVPAAGTSAPATPPPATAAAAAPAPAAPATPAPAAPDPAAALPAWVADFQTRAVNSGVKAETASAALKGVTINQQVTRLDRNQAEYNSTFGDYLGQRVNQRVVERGRAELTRNAALLAGLQERHGVPAAAVVALWGLESGYGANTGSTPVLPALATLAFDGRRRTFYEGELMALLRLAEAGEVDLLTLKGSWAGALGQVQFMPSTFQAHAVDADGDGRRDLWGSVADALASAATYLQHLGWRRGEPWGVEVLLPAGFDPAQAEVDVWLETAEWGRRGLRMGNGAALADQLAAWPKHAALVLPAGVDGPAFLVFHNFKVFMDWNRSVFYALTAGYLSDRLAGGGPLVGRLPAEQRLRRAEVVALQQALARLGQRPGGADGMVGLQTRQALRAWQHAHGLLTDGYPTLALIARITQEAGLPVTGGAAPVATLAPSGKPAAVTLAPPGKTPAAPIPTPNRAAGTPRTMERIGKLDKARIQALQRRLNKLGYAAGAEDGVLGEATRAAIAVFRADRERAQQLPSPALMDQIRSEAAALRAQGLGQPSVR